MFQTPADKTLRKKNARSAGERELAPETWSVVWFVRVSSCQRVTDEGESESSHDCCSRSPLGVPRTTPVVVRVTRTTPWHHSSEKLPIGKLTPSGLEPLAGFHATAKMAGAAPASCGRQDVRANSGYTSSPHTATSHPSISDVGGKSGDGACRW